MERRVEEQQVLTRLGNAYYGQHDFKQAAECNRLSLNIAKELRDRSAEARAYGSLSDDYSYLNDYKQTAVEYGTLNLTTFKTYQIKNKEPTAYERLINAFLVFGDFVSCFW